MKRTNYVQTTQKRLIDENIGHMSTYSDADDKQEVSLKTGGQTKEHVSDEDIQRKDAEDNQEKVLLKKGSKHRQGKAWNKKIWRKLPVISKKFTSTVDKKKWKKIVPLPGSTKLRQPWTSVFHKSFREKNPCCTLAFKSQHIKSPYSRKINSPYLNVSALCTFPSCKAKYFFKMKKEPVGKTLIKISVLQRGKMDQITLRVCGCV